MCQNKTKNYPFKVIKVRTTGMIKRIIYCSNSKAKPIRSEAVSSKIKTRTEHICSSSLAHANRDINTLIVPITLELRRSSIGHFPWVLHLPYESLEINEYN